MGTRGKQRGAPPADGPHDASGHDLARGEFDVLLEKEAELAGVVESAREQADELVREARDEVRRAEERFEADLTQELRVLESRLEAEFSVERRRVAERLELLAQTYREVGSDRIRNTAEAVLPLLLERED